VCEWIELSRLGMTITVKTSCKEAFTYNLLLKELKFCPYCGKKIKEV
jgi:rRNA maturation endonuclease Nob1